MGRTADKSVYPMKGLSLKGWKTLWEDEKIVVFFIIMFWSVHFLIPILKNKWNRAYLEKTIVSMY